MRQISIRQCAIGLIGIVIVGSLWMGLASASGSMPTAWVVSPFSNTQHAQALALASKGYLPASPISTPACGWNIVNSPNPSAHTDHLYEVAAISPNNVWAVGYYRMDNVINQTLVEHWDGSQWSVVPSPNVANSNLSMLTGVAAVTASDIWAVGVYHSNPNYTLTEHWNGVEWSIVPSPNVLTYTTALNDVGAVSTNDVWAVGYYEEFSAPFGTIQRSLTMHWNGVQWSVVPSPNVGSGDTLLRGVLAISANDVWAVGSSGQSNTERNLTLHWDGGQWNVVPSPNVNTRNNNYLMGAVALGTNDVWANGTYIGLSTLMHWNGTAWGIVSHPTPIPDDVLPDYLYAITAHATNDVWGVGIYVNDTNYPSGKTLTEHWDGVEWSIVPSPNVLTCYGCGNTLRGAAAVSENDVWAVGNDNTYSPFIFHTLIEHYTGPCGASTPTPTSTPAASTPTPIPTLTHTHTLTPSPTPPPSSCEMDFTDVQETDYFYQAVLYLYCEGAVSGYSDGTFRPYNSVTRAQLSKIVVLAIGWELECPDTGHFTDVSPDNPFYCYVETAYAHSSITGYSDGTFRPDNTVTRAQLCKVVVLGMGWTMNTSGGPHFGDVPATQTFYAYIETAYNRGIISGYSDGTFRPEGSGRRGAIATVVYQAVIQGDRE